MTDERTVRAPHFWQAWVEGTVDRPGHWADSVEVNLAQADGVVALHAVDGRIDGVTGCAHKADLMALAGQVQWLTYALDSLLDRLHETGEIVDHLRDDIRKYDL